MGSLGACAELVLYSYTLGVTVFSHSGFEKLRYNIYTIKLHPICNQVGLSIFPKLVEPSSILILGYLHHFKKEIFYPLEFTSHFSFSPLDLGNC